MKTYIYPADAHGCGHFRLIWPALELIKQGHDIELCMPGDRDFFRAQVADGVVKKVFIPSDADVIVMQRVTHKHLAQAVSLIREQGVAVVMDLDDDLAHIHPRNPAWGMLHPTNGRHADHSWHNVADACRRSTLTMVSTDALAMHYQGQFGARVVHNAVPDHYLDVKHLDSDLIGWCGSVSTHPDDATDASAAIHRLVGEGFRFRMVGPGDGVQQEFNLTDEVDATGSLHIDEWPFKLAQLGVGIAPLADTRFNEAKSWLKPLEYAALGVPSVVSHRREYALLKSRTGIGTLVRRPRDWYKQIRKLVDDASYRQDTGAADREAAAKMTYAKTAWRWMEVWQEAALLR